MTSSNGNFSELLAMCAQRPVTRSFGVFFDLRLNKRLGEQWWGWWFETPSFPLLCHCDVTHQLWNSVTCGREKLCYWIFLTKHTSHLFIQPLTIWNIDDHIYGTYFTYCIRIFSPCSCAFSLLELSRFPDDYVGMGNIPRCDVTMAIPTTGHFLHRRCIIYG